MVLGVSEDVDLEIVGFFFFFFLCVGGGAFLEYHLRFEKESRAFRATKSHPAEGSWGGNRSARRAL